MSDFKPYENCWNDELISTLRSRDEEVSALKHRLEAAPRLVAEAVRANLPNTDFWTENDMDLLRIIIRDTLALAGKEVADG